jgi:hypothetical protein
VIVQSQRNVIRFAEHVLKCWVVVSYVAGRSNEIRNERFSQKETQTEDPKIPTMILWVYKPSCNLKESYKDKIVIGNLSQILMHYPQIDIDFPFRRSIN